MDQGASPADQTSLAMLPQVPQVQPTVQGRSSMAGTLAIEGQALELRMRPVLGEDQPHQPMIAGEQPFSVLEEAQQDHLHQHAAAKQHNAGGGDGSAGTEAAAAAAAGLTPQQKRRHASPPPEEVSPGSQPPPQKQQLLHQEDKGQGAAASAAAGPQTARGIVPATGSTAAHVAPAGSLAWQQQQGGPHASAAAATGSMPAADHSQELGQAQQQANRGRQQQEQQQEEGDEEGQQWALLSYSQQLAKIDEWPMWDEGLQRSSSDDLDLLRSKTPSPAEAGAAAGNPAAYGSTAPPLLAAAVEAAAASEAAATAQAAATAATAAIAAAAPEAPSPAAAPASTAGGSGAAPEQMSWSPTLPQEGAMEGNYSPVLQEGGRGATHSVPAASMQLQHGQGKAAAVAVQPAADLQQDAAPLSLPSAAGEAVAAAGKDCSSGSSMDRQGDVQRLPDGDTTATAAAATALHAPGPSSGAVPAAVGALELPAVADAGSALPAQAAAAAASGVAAGNTAAEAVRGDPSAYYVQVVEEFLEGHPDRLQLLRPIAEEVLRRTGSKVVFMKQLPSQYRFEILPLQLEPQPAPAASASLTVKFPDRQQLQKPEPTSNTGARVTGLADGCFAIWDVAPGADSEAAADPELLAWRPGPLRCKGVIMGHQFKAQVMKDRAWVVVAALLLWQYHWAKEQQPSSLQGFDAWQQLCRDVPAAAAELVPTGVTALAQGVRID